MNKILVTGGCGYIGSHTIVDLIESGYDVVSVDNNSRSNANVLKGIEQITGKKSDRRVDVYALGCVLYVATLGLRPFGSGPEAMSKILMSKYKRPRELNPEFPEDLEAIIVKALSPDQDHRYETAEEMRNALERWLLNGGSIRQ